MLEWTQHIFGVNYWKIRSIWSIDARMDEFNTKDFRPWKIEYVNCLLQARELRAVSKWTSWWNPKFACLGGQCFDVDYQTASEMIHMIYRSIRMKISQLTHVQCFSKYCTFWNQFQIYKTMFSRISAFSCSILGLVFKRFVGMICIICRWKAAD
jgi:hypothetical protein